MTLQTSRRSGRRAAAGALLLGFAAAAVAGPPRLEFPLSLAEAQERAAARFSELDTDGSGDLSAQELAEIGHRRFVHRLGPPHHPAPPGPGADRRLHMHGELEDEVFERLDENGDGLLSREEFDARAEVRREAMQRHLFARLDRDGSGGVTPDELPDFSHRLQAMDADGDGIVTRDEARAHKDARREARREARGGR